MTTPHHQLYTGPFRVSVGDRGGPTHPGRALLFTLADGALVRLDRAPSVTASLRYRLRYDVDLGDHTIAWADQLPTATGGLSFQAAFEARWRVTDPVEVVTRGMADVHKAQSEVCVAMRDALWHVSGHYSVERLDEFAQFVRATVCDRQHPLPVGITVESLVVRLYLDELAKDHLRSIKSTEYATQQARADHTKISTEEQLAAARRATREKEIVAAAQSEGGLFAYLVAQDPSRLHELLNEVAHHDNVTRNQKSQLLKEMVEAGLIQPGEAHRMWEEIHRPVPLFGATGAAGAVAGAPGTAPGALTAGSYPLPGMVVPPEGAAAPPRPRGPVQADPRQAVAAAPPAGAGGAPPTPAPVPAPAPVPTPAPVPAPAAHAGPAPYGPAPVPGPGPQPVSVSPSAPDPVPAADEGQGPDQGGSANVTGATPVGRDRRRTPDAPDGTPG